jgi:hypothetical protein
MDKVEDQMEARGKQENVTKNGNSFEEKPVDRKESGIPIYSPTMITMRAPSDMMDREAIVAFNQNPESSTTNDGQPRNDMERGRHGKGCTMNLKEGSWRSPKLNHTEK